MNVGVSVLLAVVLALCYHSNGAFSVRGECEHGTLSTDRKSCVCDPCWTGEDCSIRANNAPYFGDGDVEVTLTYDHLGGEPLFVAQATDLDEDHCPHDDKTQCPCSAVKYSITSNNDDAAFSVDTATGQLTINQPFTPLYREYSVQIGAQDEDGNFGTMLLVIDSKDMAGPEASSDQSVFEDFNDGVYNAQIPHSLHKRSITLPTNATFSLVKYGAHASEVEMRVGTRIQFQLDITFPQGDTDMQVELFAPDSDNIIMMLCNVEVTTGGNIVVSGTTTATMESLDDSVYNDRAIIALGTVSNSGADTVTMEPSIIKILYEAVMVESTHTVHDTEYWVSAGAEFNNKNDVWVGQASFTAKTDDDSSTFTSTPEFNLQGPSSLEIGTSALFSLDMYIPNPAIDLQIDVFASVNVSDVMSICAGKLVSVSESYSCSIGDLWNYEPTMMADGNTIGYGRLHMNLGRPLNKLARESTNVTEHRLTFQFVVKMHNDENLVGNPYWLGSSVQIGTSKIWAGQIQISAIAQTAGVAVSPSFTTSFIGNDKISPTDLVQVQLDVDIPLDSNADYTLEILVPFNESQSVFQACSVAVIAVGSNLGCLSTDELEPVYEKSTDDTLIPDKLTLPLGKISNVGEWGWTNPNSTDVDKNVLRLSITFKGTNHSLAEVGSIHDVILGIYVGTTRLVVGKVAIEVGVQSPAPEITSENSPSFNMYFASGENSAVFGETVKFILDVTTVRETVYSPMDFEFIMANKSGNPMAHICKVEVEEVGKNTPCVIKDYVDSVVESITSFGDNVYDRALLNLASMCNMNISDDAAEDHVKLGVSVVLLDQPEYQTDNKTWLSAGVMYSPSTLWVGQLAVYAKLTGPGPSASQAPYLAHVPYNSTVSHVPHGFPARHMIRIKLSPNDTTSLKINVTTLDDAVSICGLRYARSGAAYPCADNLLKDKTGIVDGEDLTLGVNKEGYIDLGLVSNVGSLPVEQTDDFDDNTLEVELSAKMTVDTTLAPDNSPHEIQLVLTYDSSPELSVTSTVTLTATSDTSSITDTLADSVNASSYVSSISGTNDSLPNEVLDTIVPGESKRVMIEVVTELNNTSQLKVKVMTPIAGPVDIMHVDYVGVYEAGSNLPCVKREQTAATYEPRSGSTHLDIGTLDIGYFCNTGKDTTDPSANTLLIEGVIRLDRDAAVSIGDQLTFHSSVNSNDQELHIFSHILTVGDATTFVDCFEINETAQSIEGVINNETAAITMTIGEVKTIPIVFTIPPYMSAKVNADIRMPVNTSAILTVSEAKLVASGKNVPDMELMTDHYDIKEVRHFNTSQITGYDYSIGVISNAGMAQRSHEYLKWDDTFTLEVTMQMADNELAQDTSTHKVSFGLDVSKFIYILDVIVTVSRLGSEVLEFNVSSTVDEVNSTSTRIEVDTLIGHQDISTREGMNCALNIFLPPYVSYADTIITSTYKQIEDVQDNDNAVTILFGPLFFTDAISMTTVIEANASFKVPPGISGSDSVFQFEVVCDTFDQYNLTSNLDYVNFTTTTTAESGSSCTPAALGMQTNVITDCQISASRDSNTDAINGRHTIGTGWSPFIHPGKVREERYFQVHFGVKTLVHTISLQQSGTAKANKVTVRHSDDGISWVEDIANEIIVDPLLADQDLTVSRPVSSRYIRVMVTDTTDNTQQGLYKFEFTGCATTNDMPADICGFKESTPLADFHSRSFLVVGSTVYVCDGRKKDLGIQQVCFSTSDDQSWIELDARVGSMLGYDSEEPRVYAVSSDGLYYMSSVDGSQWETSVPDDVTGKKTSLTFKPAKKVPLDGDIKLNAGDPHADYQDGSYGATSIGLKKLDGVWNEKFRWSDCC